MLDKLTAILENLHTIESNKSPELYEKPVNFIYDGLNVDIKLNGLKKAKELGGGFHSYELSFVLPHHSLHHSPNPEDNLLFSISMPQPGTQPVVSRVEKVFVSSEKEALLTSINIEKFVEFMEQEVRKIKSEYNYYVTQPETPTVESLRDKITDVRLRDQYTSSSQNKYS